MAENLNYETKDSYCYENAPANCEKYGRLYTWEAALNACPPGWHLPSREEFETLVANVGEKKTAGIYLKSTAGWDDNEEKSGNGVDGFGFNALPAAGYRSYGGYFPSAGESAFFWSATEINEYLACNLALYYYSESASLNNLSRDDAYSVRCLRD